MDMVALSHSDGSTQKEIAMRPDGKFSAFLVFILQEAGLAFPSVKDSISNQLWFKLATFVLVAYKKPSVILYVCPRCKEQSFSTHKLIYLVRTLQRTLGILFHTQGCLPYFSWGLIMIMFDFFGSSVYHCPRIGHWWWEPVVWRGWVRENNRIAE